MSDNVTAKQFELYKSEGQTIVNKLVNEIDELKKHVKTLEGMPPPPVR